MRSKILAALSALAIAVGMVAFTTTTAGATVPTVVGSAVCNPTTGLFDITWTVGGDTRYSEQTATIKEQSVATAPTLVEQSVKAAGFVTGLQAGVAAGTHSLTVKVQWTNYPTGVLVSKTGSVTTSGECTIPTPDDATASATPTAATCEGPGGVTFEITNATWENNTDLTDGSRKAIANEGHLFPGGHKTIDVGYQIQPQLTGAQCTPPPCLDKSAVSYTYDPATNSGVITVAAKAGYSDTLCKPFWVVAASWKFIGNTMWPQQLDKWNPATGANLNTSTGAIDKVGVYNYAANVDCGQGDIYATFDAPGVPTVAPPKILYGSDNPYDENFLHDMGFTGPDYPTYTVQDAGACNAVTAGVVFQGYECNVFAPLVLSGTHVTFTVKYDDAPFGTVTGVVPGSYELLSNFAAQTGPRYFGQVTVTAQADPGYTLLSVGTPVPLTANTAPPTVVKMATMQTTWVLDANRPQDCPTVVTVVPVVTFTDNCGVDNDAIIGGGDTTKIDYTIVDARDANGIGLVTVTAAAKTGYVFAAGAYTGPWSQTFTNVPCPIKVKPLAPAAFDPTCPSDPNAQSGYIQLDLKTGLNYFIDGIATTTAKNDRVPGLYTISVTVDQGYELEGPDEWTLRVNEPFCPPTLALLSTTASSSNLTCKAAGSYTLAATEGIAWFVNGSTTATPAGTYQRSTPGVVTAEAKIIDTINDGWEDNAQTNWTFTFTNPVDCLPTLAFTGSNGGNLGLLLSGGFLLFGGTIIAFERRFRREIG